jgi:hypothetical protein
MDNFEFTIRVTKCEECPHRQNWPFGLDCELNNSDWPFQMINKGKGGVSKNCPYRREASNGSNGNRT